jgi:hypothetical protein
VELWAYRNVKFIALRWFGISDKDMPFPPETTSTEASTSEEPTIETTTVEVTDETTTDLMDESSSTTSVETDPPETTERTTDASPRPTAQPTPQPVFPDLWSLLLGIVIGILLTSLAVFVATCFWWVWGTPGSKIIIANNPAYTLPRLEVTSNSSQKSITGSMGSQTSSADPFWIKSKEWAHIP